MRYYLLRTFALLLPFFGGTKLFAQKYKVVLPIGHLKSIWGAEFSPDGRRVVTASTDNTAKIWDVSSGALLLNLRGHKDYLESGRFSPDGKKIVTASCDSTARIWDARSGKMLAELRHGYRVNSASFSGDGKFVLTASGDNTAKIWNADDGTLVQNLAHNGNVYMAEFSADDKLVVTTSYDSTVKIWDATTGKVLQTIRNGRWYFNEVHFSPDGKNILARSLYNVEVYEVRSGLLLQVVAVINLEELYRGKYYYVNSATFSPDGKRIVTGSGDSTAKVWNVETGELISDMRGFKEGVTCVRFSPDGEKILVCAGKSVQLWDGVFPVMLVKFEGVSSQFFGGRFSPDGKKIVVTSWDNSAKVFDATAGILLSDLRGHSWNITNLKYSPDRTKIIATYEDGTAKLWDADFCSPPLNLTGHNSMFGSGSFSPDSKRALTVPVSDTAKLWDAVTGTLIANLIHKDIIMYSNFSPDGKWIVTPSWDSTAMIWDGVTGKLISSVRVEGLLFGARFSDDGKTIITETSDSILIWNATTRKLISATVKKNDTSGLPEEKYFSPDGKMELRISAGNEVIIIDVSTSKQLYKIQAEADEEFADVDWGRKRLLYINNSEADVYSMETGKKLISFLAVDRNDYILRIPAGYYQTTQGAARFLHYVTPELDVLSFEQLDIQYNRPDKVLEAMGCADRSLITSYRQAYLKRMQKLGIDPLTFESNFSIPSADFADRDKIAADQPTKQMSLHIKANDSAYALSNFNIWINEIPLYGTRGISLSANKKFLDTTINLELSDGKNIIETSVRNVNGTESYRIPLNLRFRDTSYPTQRLYFIGIGIDKFAESSQNLSWSVKDIRDLARKLKARYKNRIIIDTLFDRNVNVANVSRIRKRLLGTTINDKVLLSYSGHGLLGKDYSYFLSTYNVNFKDPANGGLPYEMIESLMDSIPARKKLMLIDACHSGEVDKDELQKYGMAQTKLPKGITKGIKNPSPKTPALGLKNSFELMQQLFLNLGRSTGTTIISAAAGNQFALESGDLSNGVFTYCVLQFLRDNPSSSISELKNYVIKKVPEMTKGLQVPTTRAEVRFADWEL